MNQYTQDEIPDLCSRIRGDASRVIPGALRLCRGEYGLTIRLYLLSIMVWSCTYTRFLNPRITYKDVPSLRSLNRALKSDSHPLVPGVERIIGGRSTGGPVGYQVGLTYDRNMVGDDRPLCGGSLIAPQAVLTAAHCHSYGSWHPCTRVFVNMYNWNATNHSGLVDQFEL